MKPFLAAVTLSMTLAGCAAAPAGRPSSVGLRLTAHPSEVIAAELAFARLAQTKGQWAAFRETAADGAEMFVPQRVKAADWLKGRAEPEVAVKWQPHAVWSSCDGSYAVTRGGWQSANGAGHFATVWQRQTGGSYKWVADMSLATERVDRAPDMVAATVADCPKRGQSPNIVVSFGGTTEADIRSGAAKDNTLGWTTTVEADGTRKIVVRLWKDGDWRDVLTDSGKAPR